VHNFRQIFLCSWFYQIMDAVRHNAQGLTLPWLKPRGFLIQRLTLKCSVLTAILKPFNRGDTTN
jgi:hypothetical protein